MKQELADKIIVKCPLLFSSLKHIEAPDGWFSLIDDASTLIEQYLKSHPAEAIKAEQIKSKFGGLRFYVSRSISYIDGVIHMAEEIASHSCEECGMINASLNDIKGCYITLCDQHIKS